jgi:hypothetical protein
MDENDDYFDPELAAKKKKERDRITAFNSVTWGLILLGFLVSWWKILFTKLTVDEYSLFLIALWGYALIVGWIDKYVVRSRLTVRKVIKRTYYKLLDLSIKIRKIYTVLRVFYYDVKIFFKELRYFNTCTVLRKRLRRILGFINDRIPDPKKQKKQCKKQPKKNKKQITKWRVK